MELSKAVLVVCGPNSLCLILLFSSDFPEKITKFILKWENFANKIPIRGTFFKETCAQTRAQIF